MNRRKRRTAVTEILPAHLAISGVDSVQALLLGLPLALAIPYYIVGASGMSVAGSYFAAGYHAYLVAKPPSRHYNRSSETRVPSSE